MRQLGLDKQVKVERLDRPTPVQNLDQEVEVSSKHIILLNLQAEILRSRRLGYSLEIPHRPQPNSLPTVRRWIFTRAFQLTPCLMAAKKEDCIDAVRICIGVG